MNAPNGKMICKYFGHFLQISPLKDYFKKIEVGKKLRPRQPLTLNLKPTNLKYKTKKLFITDFVTIGIVCWHVDLCFISILFF